MTMRYVLLLGLTTLLALPARAATGLCTTSDGSTTVSIRTTEQGQVVDLTLTTGKDSTSFPEANARSVALTSFGFTFSAKETTLHDAIELDISGSNGRIKYGGNDTMLECDWTQN